MPQNKSAEEIAFEREKLTGADSNWKKRFDGFGMNGSVCLRLTGLPQGDVYGYGATLTVLSGESEGLSVTLKEIDGEIAVVGDSFGVERLHERMSLVKAGDRVHIDNSDYLAAQTYYRHQTPENDDYIGWNQFKTADGSSIYPVRDLCVGPMIASGSCGSLQTGKFGGKMIVVAATMDESAFPWQADWYRKKVQKHLGDKTNDYYRLYFFDHCFHDDGEKTVDELHLVSYLGGLHQALLDLSDWVERGIEPRKTSNYTVQDGQIVLAQSAENRNGMQPLIEITVKGKKKYEAKIGEDVRFTAKITLPDGIGKVTGIEWSFEGEQDYPVKTTFSVLSGNESTAEAFHIYGKEGIYFAVARVSVQRKGTNNIYTQIYNLDRMKVEVE